MRKALTLSLTLISLGAVIDTAAAKPHQQCVFFCPVLRSVTCGLTRLPILRSDSLDRIIWYANTHEDHDHPAIHSVVGRALRGVTARSEAR